MADTYFRDFQPSPGEVVTNGNTNFGIYNHALRKSNLVEAHKPYGNLPLPNYMRLKEWQAFQLGNEDYFFMVAIYNAKTMAIAQFIMYDIKNRKKTKFEKKVPIWGIKVAQSLYGTESWYDGKNFKLRATNNLANGTVEIDVDIKGFGGGLPDAKGHFTGHFLEGQVQPQAVVMPFEGNRGMYSMKCLMHMDGQLAIGGKDLRFDKATSHMIMDDHKGYYPYVMQYDWVTGASFDAQGRLVGFNLTDNQVKDQEHYNENCLWVDDKITLLPPVKVTRPGGVEKDWLIKDQHGRIDLVFTPVENTRVDVNLLLIRSDYHGPYGFYKGYIMDADNQKISLDGIFGVGEQFYLRA